jgi:hypothetical protein
MDAFFVSHPQVPMIKPLVMVGIVAALLSALAMAGRGPSKTLKVGASPTPLPSGSSEPGFTALCPRGTLPDEGVCIPVPAASALR